MMKCTDFGLVKEADGTICNWIFSAIATSSRFRRHLRPSSAFHDRFLILDDKELYLIGASLKDLGKKCFGFTKMDASEIVGIKARVK